MPKLELSHARLLMIRNVLLEHVALGTYPGLVETIDRALAEPEMAAQPPTRLLDILKEIDRALAEPEAPLVYPRHPRCGRVQHGSNVQCELDNLHKGSCKFPLCKECGRSRPEGSVPATAALDLAVSRGYVAHAGTAGVETGGHGATVLPVSRASPCGGRYMHSEDGTYRCTICNKWPEELS